MSGIRQDKSGGDALVTFHCLHLTWSQWTSVLTENIISKNLKVHIHSAIGMHCSDLVERKF